MFLNKRIVRFVCLGAIVLMGTPALAHAQRGRGRGRVVAVRPVVVAPYYYSPFYDPFYWGGWGYPGPFPPGYYGSRFGVESEARIQVTPRQTEVYVDGYRAGVVDDFDGIFQRLRVEPGEHVIELYLDGHRSIRENILFTPGETYRLRHVMEPLAPGEAAPARPVPIAAPQLAGAPAMYDAFGRPDSNVAPRRLEMAGASAIAIRVQPADAMVLVDGERWQASASGDPLEIRVTPGAHRIEVRKEGYVPFTSAVEVRPGETSTINVSLTRTGGE